MDHITFARFPDRKHAADGIRGMRANGKAGLRISVHPSSCDAAAFDQLLQHSGDLTETGLRHSLVVGTAAGITFGAGFGSILAWAGIFPGSVGQGLMFGAFMGVLLGIVMMAIFGVGFMDQRLQRLARGLQSGEVVLTVHTLDRNAAANVRAALVSNGARVAQKALA